MFQYRHIVLTHFAEPHPVLEKLYGVFTETLNREMTYREFRFYYFWHTPLKLDITFIEKNGETVGFVCAAFYRHSIGQKQYTICRGAAGIRSGYRGGALPSRMLCAKYIRYRLQTPFARIYITGFMANPILYAMICRYTHLVYPKQGVRIPEKIERLRDAVIKLYGMQRKQVAPWVLNIHFPVQLSAADETRIAGSTEKNVVFYRTLNQEGFNRKLGVFTLVPVSWYNVLVSCFQIGIRKPLLRKQKLVRAFFYNLLKKNGFRKNERPAGMMR